MLHVVVVCHHVMVVAIALLTLSFLSPSLSLSPVWSVMSVACAIVCCRGCGLVALMLLPRTVVIVFCNVAYGLVTGSNGYCSC